jgi:hypothetical protein
MRRSGTRNDDCEWLWMRRHWCGRGGLARSRCARHRDDRQSHAHPSRHRLAVCARGLELTRFERSLDRFVKFGWRERIVETRVSVALDHDEQLEVRIGAARNHGSELWLGAQA